MAFAQVQTSAQATGTGSSVVITLSATTQYNVVVVHIKMATNAETCTSVTDDVGNTYVLQAVVDNSTTNRMYQAYGVQVTGGATAVTVNFSAASVSKRCGADEFSGGAHSNAEIFDTSTTGNISSNTTGAASTLTPAATGELIVATYAANIAVTWTNGSGYTLYNGAGSVSCRSQYKLSSAASETAPISWDVTANVVIRATAFKAYVAPVASSGFRIFGDDQLVS